MHIELIKPHTHAGRLYEPGELLDLDEASAQWLIEIGAARQADTKSQTQIKTRKGD